MSSDGPCAAPVPTPAAGAVSSSSAAEEGPPQPQGMERGSGTAGEECSAAAEQEHGLRAVERRLSEASLCRTDEEAEEDGGDEEEEEEEEAAAAEALELGPRVSIKEQLEKDKDDESLRRWKEQLLGSVDLNSVGETLEPEVKITSLSILSPGRPDIVLPLPADPSTTNGPLFTLKEGSAYRLKFTFSIAGNIVSGLRYTNSVWKTGIKVDSTKEMLGTFSPQTEPYTYLTPEETTPSGIFARGSYSAKTKFLDDDRKCYLEMNYNFDIRRDWT